MSNDNSCSPFKITGQLDLDNTWEQVDELVLNTQIVCQDSEPENDEARSKVYK